MSEDILEKFDDERLERLEAAFRESRYPDQLTLVFVAADIGASDEDVKKWFEARLLKWRKEEGFVPIAERAANLARSIHKSSEKHRTAAANTESQSGEAHNSVTRN